MATVFYCNGVHATITAAAKCIDKEKEYVVFADDKATVSLEAAILEQAKNHVCFNVTVTSFTRYLSRSGKTCPALTKEGSSMAIRRILSKEKAYDVLPSSTQKKHLAASLYEMLAQLKSACIKPEALLCAAEEESGLLSLKLKDLSALYTEYEDYLEQTGFTDQGGYLSLLPAYLRAFSPLKGKEVFLVGYTSFTRQMQEVLTALFETGARVTGFFPTGAAAETKAAREAFLTAAQNAGEEVKEGDMHAFSVQTCPAAEHLRALLGSVKNYKGEKKLATNAVGILAAASPSEEAEFVARRIADLARKGVRYREMGVIAPDTAAYRPVLAAAFQKYGVPFFADEKRTLSSHPAYRYLADYLALFSHGLTAERVFAVVGSPYFKDGENVSAFRNYVERFGVIGNRFFTEFTFSAPEKEGAEGVRQAFCALYEPLSKTATAREYVAALLRFVQKTALWERNEALAAGFDECRPDVASFTRQTPLHLKRLLAEIDRVLGDVTLTVKEFAETLESGAEADEMNLIPTSIDEVTVAPPEKMLSGLKRRLFAVGMTASVPAVTSDTAFLSDKELGTLEARGVNIDPRISEINERAFEEAVEALCCFTERLVITYPAANAKGESQRPSELITLVKNALTMADGTPLKETTFTDYEALAALRAAEGKYDLAAQAYATPAAAEESFFAGYYGYMDGEKDEFDLENGYYAYLQEQDSLSGEDGAYRLAAALNGEKEGKVVHGSVVPSTVSPSSLENYFRCPYSHFLNYVLRLAEKKTAEVNHLESGTFIHAVLENFALRMIKGGVKRADVPTLAAEICKEVANSEEFAAKRSSRRNEHMIKELIAEAERTCLTVYDQIARSKYRILAAEQKFGYKEALKPLKLFTGKRNVYLRGTMDRVDESDDYVRVIDYKTGEISTKESDLFVGTKAQLYLYMNTAMENYDKPLAGAYYFPISREFEKEPEETRLRGKTLLNLDAVAQQDIAFEKPFDKQKSSVIDLTLFYNKEGVLSTAGRSTNALSADALRAYATYSKLLTEGALAEMEEGFIAPTPYGEQCQYCTYSGICGREEALDGAPRSVGKVKPETIVTAVSHAEGNGDSLTDSESSSTDKTPATPAPKTTQTGRTNNDEKEDA